MKTIILATTALVATAGIAAAGDITLNAAANFGVKYDESAANQTTVHNELDFGIAATGEADNGVTFGASIDLDTDSNNSTVTTNAVGDPEAFISFSGLTLTVGAVDAADDISNFSDVGYDGIGVDDDTDGLAAGGSHDVRFDYAMDSISFALSADSSGSDWALSVGGSFSGFDATLGYSENAGVDVTSLALGYGMGDVALDVYFADSSAGTQAYGVDVTYVMNALTLTLAYGDTDAAGDDADYGIGASYDLGGGLAVAGGIGSVDGSNKADFGVVMSF